MFKTMQEAAAELRAAMESGDSDRIQKAWEAIGMIASNNAYEKLKDDMDEYRETQDQAILERRGARVLTQEEQTWYENLIQVMKSDNPKQAFVEIIGSDEEEDVMPSSIFEDVFRNLTETHPLLSKIGTESVGYLSKWILNNHTSQSAVWGPINSEITQEITSDLKVVKLTQNKLSCFVILERDMAELGPVFLDTYIRQVMGDAMAVGCETGTVSGTGIDMPIGMDRDLTTLSGSGYAQKAAVTVTDFTPESYGKLLAAFAKDDDGKQRVFSSVALICNQEDYLTKIMPATTVLNGMGVYVNNLFPFPTEVIVSNVLETGKAILGLLDEYKLFIGKSSRNNSIEYTDDYKFLEDQRVFKVVEYADGRAYDNTSFQLLDISGLNPAYITVQNVGGSAGEAVEEA